MNKIIALTACLWSLVAGATNITNYPVRTTFNGNYWFLLSDVPAQTNWNLPGNYVASTADLNSTSNTLWQLSTNLVATNIYYTNLFVTNLVVFTNTTDIAYITNLYASIAYITNLYSSNAYFYNLTVTNPITNLSLTANTIVKADANKALASVANGSGVLTNNGTGTFGWIPINLLSVTNPPDSYFTNLYATNIYAVSVVASNAYFTNLWASNAYIENLYATNIFTQQIKYYTNQGTMAPDFSHGYDAIATNADFTFLAPINTDAGGKFAETTVKKVVNSGGGPILATLPANFNAVPGSVWYITNTTFFTFVIYGTEQSNCYAVPIK